MTAVSAAVSVIVVVIAAWGSAPSPVAGHDPVAIAAGLRAAGASVERLPGPVEPVVRVRDADGEYLIYFERCRDDSDCRHATLSARFRPSRLPSATAVAEWAARHPDSGAALAADGLPVLERAVTAPASFNRAAASWRTDRVSFRRFLFDGRTD